MRSFISCILLSAAVLASGCAVQSQHDDDEGPSSLEQSDALSKIGKTLVGSYKGEAWYPRFELAADGTYAWDSGIRCIKAPCPSGDAGSWAVYRSLFTGRRYVGMFGKDDEGTRIERWFRIVDGKPVVLVGAFGTEGTFEKQEEAPAAGCAATLCGPGTYCYENSGKAECLAYKTCAGDDAPTCSDGEHCVDAPIMCITTPCPPTMPRCDANVCPEKGSYVNCMPGPGPVKPECTPSYKAWITANCPDVGFAY